jgi:hypothetical protein
LSIQPKEKPCKGTGQATGYGCGTLTLYRTYGLGHMCCYPEWLYESDAGKAKMLKAIIKVQKPRLEFAKAEREHKDTSELKKALKLTKTVVHAYIRLRDEGKPCISCGEPWRSDFQAGHYHKAELYETLKFNLKNIHGQCPGCNIHKDGNLEQYNINLPLRIGDKAFIVLQSYAQIDKHQSKVWDIEKLKEIRENVKKLTNKL